MLVLTVNLIYHGGNLLQDIFSPKKLSPEYIGVKGYTLVVHILFIMILWRHYQYW
jgi:hypothetical protein